MGKSMGKSMVSGSDSSPKNHKKPWCVAEMSRSWVELRVFIIALGTGVVQGSSVSVKVRGNIYELLLACLPPDFIVKEIRCQLDDLTCRGSKWGLKPMHSQTWWFRSGSFSSWK